MDIDSLKSDWKELDGRLRALEDQNRRLAREFSAGRAGNEQRRLARSFRTNGFAAMAVVLLAPTLYWMLHLSAALSIAYGVYGAMAGILAFAFARYIESRNFMSCTTVEALRHAANIARRRMAMFWFTFSTGIVIASWFFYELDEPDLIIAACVGLVIGAAFGIYKFRSQSRTIRRMLADLQSDGDGVEGAARE